MSETNKPLRRVAARKWPVLTAAGVVGLALTGAAGAGAIGAGQPAQPPETLWLADASGGEGGEGGEGGAAVSAASGDELLGLLVEFGEIEGHLIAGQATFAIGDPSAALHYGHPKAKIYEAIEHELEEHNVPAFEAELVALEMAIKGGKPAADVEAAHAAAVAGLAKARAALAPSAKTRLLAVSMLLRKAAEEYGDGVKDGAITELDEYQDAWGFLRAAGGEVDQLAQSDEAPVKAAAVAAKAAIDRLAAELPDVTPKGPLTAGSDAFFVAAATIELATYGIK